MRKTGQKRVLMLLENCSYPKDRRVCNEALTLTTAGYQVTVICPGEAGQCHQEIVQDVSVYRFRQRRPGNGFFGYLWEYGYAMAASFLLSLKVLFREGFDIIHAHNPPDLFVLIAMFYKLIGKRFVFDHHDLSPEMYRARFPGEGNRLAYSALVFFEKLSCSMADHIIATNESYKKVAMDRGKVPAERITVVRNGPDLNRFKIIEPDPELRQKAGTILGYVGVMGFQDGLDYLLRALRHLVDDLGRTDFYCVAIGTGAAWDDLVRMVPDLKLKEHVWFTGAVSDQEVLKYLSTADICVDPDPSNAFTDRSTMIKMMEYMALAKPIVAFDLPEHRVSAEEAALYAHPNDELDFAKQIVRLMDDPGRRERMGRVGRRRIETELAWLHQQQHLVRAYRTFGGGNEWPSEARAESRRPTTRRDKPCAGPSMSLPERKLGHKPADELRRKPAENGRMFSTDGR